MDEGGAWAIVEEMLRRQQAGDDTFLDELVAVDLVNHAAGPQGRSGLARILRTIDHDLGPVTLEQHHLVVQVDSMDATVTDLRTKGIEVAEPGSPDDSADFLTTWITDPDGNRIELVQWPAGHPDGLTAADWS